MPSPLAAAAALADDSAVQALLRDGAAVDGTRDDDATPLFLVCDSDAPDAERLAVARLLLEAGAFFRGGGPGDATPLHAAARRGPAALVELLLRHGALVWQKDAAGRRPVDETTDERIAFLADGPRIEDPRFREAVAAIHAGDAAALERLLDAHPYLLEEPAKEPDLGPRGYFSDPKLFWFVANNPTLIPSPPPNIIDIAKRMIARGVDQADLDYALELVMSNALLERDLQLELVRTLVDAGAAATPKAILVALGHEQTEPIRWLLDHGLPLTAPIAAALGRTEELPALLEGPQKNDALDMAVIHRQTEAARLCLEAGADPNHFMAVHTHSTPAHQAAWNDDAQLLALLVEHGARLDVEDRLWRSTPLGWAVHGEKAQAIAYLRSLC